MQYLSLYRLILSALCCGFMAAALAAGPVAVPKAEGHVTDLALVFSAAQRQELEDSLVGYEKETTHEIAVLTVGSLDGEPIEQYALRVARAWQLGKRSANNGILVVLAPNDRQVRIEIGTGMATYVTDTQAQSIVDESMTPAFRRGDFAGGLRRGVGRLMVAARAYKVARE